MIWPHVAVVMTTYYPDGEEGKKRGLASIQAFNSWEKYLHYDEAPDDHLHVVQADDNDYKNSPNFRWFRGYLVGGTEKQHRKGVGASLNAGFRRAYQLFGDSAIILYMVDDWALTSDFNLAPWIKLLTEREDVGMVRIGPPHPGISGVVEVFTEEWQGWGLRLDRQSFAYAQRPALYHKRFIDAYGWFDEGLSALECERLYVERFCSTPGPDIVLALPHPFLHLDTISLSALEP